MKAFEHIIKAKHTFNKREISSGVEGIVYKSKLDNIPFVLKRMNLSEIVDDKGIFKSILKLTPNQLYKLFLTEHVFNKPTFIEIVAQTLINQIVLQKICPNFVLNYYWRFKQSNGSLFLESFNEYINCCTFDEWLNKNTYTLDIYKNAIFQIMVAIYTLKKYFNMLHTDLHLGNVLVHTVKPGGYWVYSIDNKKYYVPNLGFVFVINDYGFAWIPDQLYITWHKIETLDYITHNGEEFYDLSMFIKSVLDENIPKSLVQFINSSFSKNDLNYTLTKSYYIDGKFKLLNRYPDIKKDFKGDSNTLSSKIYTIFYNLYKTPQNNIIDKFSLDVQLDISKLHQNFSHLVI
jgi:hypothetical protein